MPWRVTAAALVHACIVLKVIVAETHAERHDGGSERSESTLVRGMEAHDASIDAAGRTDKSEGVDDDVLVVCIREHHGRERCLATEVVREECTPGW